jgi:hypothetical protein
MVDLGQRHALTSAHLLFRLLEKFPFLGRQRIVGIG